MSACNPTDKRKSEQTGVIELETLFYRDVEEKDSSIVDMTLRSKKWYKGELTIEEKRTLYIKTDTAKNTTHEYALNCYLFKHVPTGMVYEYIHFSDTAKIVRSFKITDTSVALTGGNIYNSKTPIGGPKPTRIQQLADTTVKDVTYKRMMEIYEYSGKPFAFVISFFRCDKNINLQKLFTVSDSLSKIVGCLGIKGITIPSLQSKRIINSSEILFLADALSQKELSVFAAWEKNARVHSAKK